MVNLFEELKDCYECESINSIIYDENLGEYKCRNCGLVILEREYQPDYRASHRMSDEERIKSEQQKVFIPKKTSLNTEVGRILRSKVGKMPEEKITIIGRLLEVFESIIPISYAIKKNIEFYYMKCPQTLIHIKNKNKGYRPFELIYTIFYHLYFKPFGMRLFFETVKRYGIKFSPRRMFNIRLQLQNIPRFHKLFGYITAPQHQILKKQPIKVLPNYVRNFYDILRTNLQRYFNQIDITTIKRQKQNELHQSSSTSEYRNSLYQEVYKRIKLIPYEQLRRFRYSSICGFLIYFTLKKWLKKRVVSKICNITEATISNTMYALDKYVHLR